jgi:hypothetical protein
MGANATTFVPSYTSGEVLTAADLTVTNSGIPVFADSTARDNSFGGTGEKVLAEGQFAYLENTNATQYYDGAAWQSVGVTPGLIPIAPTSVGKTGASSTATASTNGQVTFALCETLTLNGVFTSAYANYRIMFAGFASTNATIAGRMSVAGTPNTSASYNRQYIVASGTAVSSQRITGGTSWSSMENINTTDADNMAIDIFNPQTAKNTSINVLSGSATASAYWQSMYGYFTATTQFDGIQFIPSAGTFSGIISVYGYNQ